MAMIEHVPAPPPLLVQLRRPLLVAAAVIALFFGGFGIWSVTATLASAALAPGTVSPDGSRRTVQHLEGGIIADIRVAEGSHVQAGDVLMVLEDVSADASVDLLIGRRRALAAARARLAAEEAGDPAISFPAWLSEDGAAADILAAERDRFAARRASRAGLVEVMERRIAQYRAEIAGLEVQIDARTLQLDLIAEEIAAVRTLLDQGLERRPRLLALQRTEADIMAARAENRAGIARARQAIAQTEAEILNLDRQAREEATAELAGIRAELSAVRDRLRAARDVLTRTTITAPLDGEVVDLRFTTLGGVVGAGEPILDIVPADEELLVEARIAPTDIDAVHPGLEARVILSSYAQRNLPRLSGTVRTVSADALIDEATGRTYYLARISVDEDDLAALDGVELVPGMPAEVAVVTGERTPFDYLADPFLDSFRRAFKEG
ncbi:HlyD family type I secretion periplasmic adaptor subunit [Inquilinus sp. CAU 1745]|uniref:HlyD family type I secretion periplasmic adaptor subunit n=1 Tax=Inquilinus sp. CAU 1745 TaxID=3140369 RepID=UPI00325ACC0D